MKTKPWPILILALLYLVGPVFNTLAAAVLMRISWVEYLHRMVAYGTWWDWFTVVAIYPAAAIAIYAVKPWSYPVYLAAMGIATIANLNDYVRYSHIFTTSAFVFTTIFNIALVSYFLIPAVRVAYFNRKLRWWESKPRYEVKVPAVFNTHHHEWKGMISNLSEGGAFVMTSHKLKEGDVVHLTFSLFNRPVSVKARVVYQSAKGLKGSGLQFDHTHETHEQMVRISRGLRLLGIEPRGGKIDYMKSFADWSKGLVTGKGWIPEVPVSALHPAHAGSHAGPSMRLVKGEHRKGRHKKSHTGSRRTGRHKLAKAS